MTFNSVKLLATVDIQYNRPTVSVCKWRQWHGGTSWKLNVVISVAKTISRQHFGNIMRDSNESWDRADWFSAGECSRKPSVQCSQTVPVSHWEWLSSDVICLATVNNAHLLCGFNAVGCPSS